MAAGPPRPRRPVKPAGPRLNEQIRAPRLRVVDQHGTQVGVISRQQALALATEAKLDLVEVAPDADPPVCRILNYGKFRYEAERKAKADKRNRPKPPHQLKLRPQIAEHDYQTKKRQAEKFLAKGEKVRFTVQLRGRMNSHPQLGERLLERYVGELATLSSVEQAVRREGNQIHLLLAPRA